MTTTPTSAGLTPAQLALRTTGLTATDLVVLSGFSKWGHPLEVWESKMGAPGKETTRAMRMGNVAEAVIADELAEKFKLTTWPATTIRDRIVPWYLATPDRFVGPTPPRIENDAIAGYGPEAVMECKLVGYRLVREWLEVDNDGCEVRVFPASVAVQTCWQMGVSRARRAYVGAFLGGWADGDEHFMAVDMDEDLYGGLRGIADRFWQDHVLTGKPPPPDASERAAEALGRIYPAAKHAVLVEAGDDAVALMRTYLDALGAAKVAEEKKDAAGNALRALIGETQTEGLISDQLKATWRTQDGRINYDALFAAHGISAEEIEKYRKPANRVLRVSALSKKEQGLRHGISGQRAA